MDVEQRALAMVDRISGPLGCLDWSEATRDDIIKALIEAIEAGDAERVAHDAYRQEVSEAVKLLVNGRALTEPAQDVIRQVMERFIIQPKTDPLVEAVREWRRTPGSLIDDLHAKEETLTRSVEVLRAALKSRGLEIREVGE